MPLRWRSGRPLFLVLLPILCCVSPAGAEDTPRNTKPFSRYKVLLSSALDRVENLELSRRRAAAIVQFLTDTQMVPPSN